MCQKIRVTVLIENTSECGLTAEHGLSLYIEYAGARILLDAGSTEAFYDNAAALGITIADLDAYVLSHGHYDHSGGFARIFRADPSAKVYIRQGALGTYLSSGGGMHEIGVPANVAAYRDRFTEVVGVKEILPNIYLVPHTAEGLCKIGEKSGLYKICGDEISADDFSHEQSLVIDTADGLVIFNSCSHAGASNIIHEAKAACGGKQVRAYIGGLHMKGKRDGREICAFSAADIDALADTFTRENVERVYTGHCTGSAGYEELRARLGERVQRLTTGLRFEI